MSNERIDLTQFERIEKWEVKKISGGDYAFKVGKYNFSLEDAEIVAKLPNLIAELKRCYDLIDKMQHSIVKSRGDCWDCDMPIDSCDARYCERQMLEDIELGTASE